MFPKHSHIIPSPRDRLRNQDGTVLYALSIYIYKKKVHDHSAGDNEDRRVPRVP